ncbi:MAG: hypothetical protein QOH57_2184 [Mycobacterium sp.]|jgi:hypothetical protein|nr:hypothetical protein [Mycobacterium sp.]
MTHDRTVDATTGVPTAPATKAVRDTASPRFSSVIALQRAAGNKATAKLLASKQVQRTPNPVVQREGEKNPADLTGTVFEKLDTQLQAKLKDKEVFTWSHPTLAETLNELSNASVATMARIGAMITATAPFLWNHVKKIGGGGWITDNFGMGFAWKDNGALADALAASDNFCKDNPITAKYYHGTTSAFRQISASPGGASMHVVTEGHTEVHIDAHQPVEGKETKWPWAGQCNYDLSAWMSHAGDVGGGGASGARGTAVGRYAVARDNVTAARKDAYYRKDKDEDQLVEADANLTAISMVVQKYAAMGAMVGSEWEGDQEMLKDVVTITKLQHAEDLIRTVNIAQSERTPSEPVYP